MKVINVMTRYAALGHKIIRPYDCGASQTKPSGTNLKVEHCNSQCLSGLYTATVIATSSIFQIFPPNFSHINLIHPHIPPPPFFFAFHAVKVYGLCTSSYIFTCFTPLPIFPLDLFYRSPSSLSATPFLISQTAIYWRHPLACPP